MKIKRIKKWHIIFVIIIGIVVYWFSQNMWVFEKKVVVENYYEFLSDTEWYSEERNSFWIFSANGDYKKEYENTDIEQIGYWKNKENMVFIETDSLGKSEWEIYKIFKDKIFIRLIRPNVGSGGLDIQLLKI